MIEKMKFLCLTGPKNDFDRAVNKYLTKFDVHLENAVAELSSYDLKPFIDNNPYKDLVSKSEDLVKRIDQKEIPANQQMTREEATEVINSAYAMLSDLNVKKAELKNQRNECNDLISQIEHFRHLDYNIHQIINLKFIKYRFGKVPHEFYTKFSKYVYDNLTTVFYECEQDRDYVWGIYFVPAKDAAQIDSIYSSLHFERIRLPDAYEGTPEESFNSITAKVDEIKLKLNDVYSLIKERLNDIADKLLLAHRTITALSDNFDVRKVAALTRERGRIKDVFYVICGWITEREANQIMKFAEDDRYVYCTCEDSPANIVIKPPTKLRNPRIFKPFEMFIKMYGLPAYNEFDPTSFVAITYSIMFGMMFGDVGQGLCLVIGGFLFYKIKKMSLGAIISSAGIFSTIFGFMYGSVFGFETIIKPIWMSPRENTMRMLFTTVGIGVFLILIGMVINIINSIIAKEWGKVLFDTNGIAGLVFYGTIISSVALMLSGHALPGSIILAIFIGIPLLIMFFKEPLTHWIEKKSHIFPEHKGMFFVETFFEMFEVLLSFMSNTISFMRVGAFALSHAGMMSVVMLLAGATTGSPNLLVIVLGNIFVASLEGLIVGIQVLRLEFYEMFSRFYKGSGKEFKSFKEKK